MKHGSRHIGHSHTGHWYTVQTSWPCTMQALLLSVFIRWWNWIRSNLESAGTGVEGLPAFVRNDFSPISCFSKSWQNSSWVRLGLTWAGIAYFTRKAFKQLCSRRWKNNAKCYYFCRLQCIDRQGLLPSVHLDCSWAPKLLFLPSVTSLHFPLWGVHSISRRTVEIKCASFSFLAKRLLFLLNVSVGFMDNQAIQAFSK